MSGSDGWVRHEGRDFEPHFWSVLTRIARGRPLPATADFPDLIRPVAEGDTLGANAGKRKPDEEVETSPTKKAKTAKPKRKGSEKEDADGTKKAKTVTSTRKPSEKKGAGGKKPKEEEPIDEEGRLVQLLRQTLRWMDAVENKEPWRVLPSLVDDKGRWDWSVWSLPEAASRARPLLSDPRSGAIVPSSGRYDEEDEDDDNDDEQGGEGAQDDGEKQGGEGKRGEGEDEKVSGSKPAIGKPAIIPGTTASQSSKSSNTESIVGIYNLGLSCYLNSVLQALSALPSLRQALTAAAETSSPLASALSKFFQLLRISKQALGEEPVMELVRAFTDADVAVNIGEMGDVQELLIKLLQALPSPITSLFDLQVRSVLTCPAGCNGPEATTSTKYENDVTLSVSLSEGSDNVLQLLQKHEAAEELDDICKIDPNLKSRKQLTSGTPRILVIHLKRRVPRLPLILPSVTYKILRQEIAYSPVLIWKGARYELCATVHHTGEEPKDGAISKCHYFAQVKDPADKAADGPWREMNDSDSSNTWKWKKIDGEIKERRSSSVTMLFYELKANE